MRGPRRVVAVVAALAIAVGVAAAIAVTGGGDDDGREPPEAEVRPAPNPAEVARPELERQPGQPEERHAKPGEEAEAEARERTARAERAAQRAYRGYLEAINARDGAALCRLLAPGSIAELDPPRRRGGCAATLRASIGHSDPRGFPVWEETILSEIEGVLAGPGGTTARVTAAIVTRFVDREQPSIESDVAHLERAGGRWRLAKPSVALHRAVGKAEIPPRVLGPP